MKSGKRVCIRLALALLLVCSCLELTHWGDRRISLVSENTASILRRTPAASITEEEQAMLEEVFQCPAVKALLDSGRKGEVFAAEDPPLRATVERCLSREDAGTACAVVFPNRQGNAVSLNWEEDGGKFFLVQRKETEGGPEYFKCFSRPGFLRMTSNYQNWDNGRVRQSLVHHDWFSWLRAEGQEASMYLHLGQNEIIPDRRIIGIFDLDKCSCGKRTRDYLSAAERDGVVLDVSGGNLPRSFVVCDHPYHEQIVYLSQLSAAALRKRVESGRLE